MSDFSILTYNPQILGTSAVPGMCNICYNNNVYTYSNCECKVKICEPCAREWYLVSNHCMICKKKQRKELVLYMVNPNIPENVKTFISKHLAFTTQTKTMDILKDYILLKFNENINILHFH